MREDYGGYARRRKKPGIGRYPMGPTNIDTVDIGSCVWYPTFVVDTDSGRRLRVSTRMKMANQVKRSKIANCLNCGGSDLKFVKKFTQPKISGLQIYTENA